VELDATLLAVVGHSGELKPLGFSMYFRSDTKQPVSKTQGKKAE